MPLPSTSGVGRAEARRRAEAVIDQWTELASLDPYTKGGIASMMVKALLDGHVNGFDWEMQRRYDEVASAAQASAYRHRPFSEPTDDTPFTVNARGLAGDVIRAAIKAGLVVAVDDRARAHIALAGSASHDETGESLRQARP